MARVGVAARHLPPWTDGWTDKRIGRQIEIDPIKTCVQTCTAGGGSGEAYNTKPAGAPKASPGALLGLALASLSSAPGVAGLSPLTSLHSAPGVPELSSWRTFFFSASIRRREGRGRNCPRLRLPTISFPSPQLMKSPIPKAEFNDSTC